MSYWYLFSFNRSLIRDGSSSINLKQAIYKNVETGMGTGKQKMQENRSSKEYIHITLWHCMLGGKLPFLDLLFKASDNQEALAQQEIRNETSTFMFAVNLYSDFYLLKTIHRLRKNDSVNILTGSRYNILTFRLVSIRHGN